MIVIVDRPNDQHVRVVSNHLEGKGARVFIADVHELGAGADNAVPAWRPPAVKTRATRSARLPPLAAMTRFRCAAPIMLLPLLAGAKRTSSY